MIYDILVTNTDMSLQSGNVVLIRRRSEEFYVQEKIVTLCVLYKVKLHTTIEDTEFIKFIQISNILELSKILENINYRKMIVYGTKMYIYSRYLRNISNKPLTLDLQGAFEELVEYSKWYNVLNRLKYELSRLLFGHALKYTSEVFTVTDELNSYIKKFKFGDNKRFIKFRCGVNNLIDTNQKLDKRSIIRKKYNISEETVVFCFSGTLLPWQKIDEVLSLFTELDKQYTNIYFAFFCNYNDSFLVKLNKAFPRKNYLVKYLSYDEYFDYLVACDVGMLIRDENITNLVAFPNKFSDYINAGLITCISKGLKEPLRILNKHNMLYIDYPHDSIREIYEKAQTRFQSLGNYYHNTENIVITELLYSTQFKKEVMQYESNDNQQLG